MDTLTQYVIYEKKNDDNNNKVCNIKILCVCYGINDAENKFNILHLLTFKTPILQIGF